MTINDKYPWLESYILSKAGVECDYKEEWQWKRFMIKGKMFLAFCAENTERCLITVKCEPAFNIQLRNTFSDIIEGYYMNKVHWNSVRVSGSVSDEIVKEMCDRGYNLILNGFSKKMKNDILSGV
ncbi:MAG: MmcQ/YjbR family DNA-binding protein [Oscillospiraceae bacterium]